MPPTIHKTMDVAVKRPMPTSLPPLPTPAPQTETVEIPTMAQKPAIKSPVKAELQNKKSTSVVGLVITTLFFMVVLSAVAVVVYLKTK